MYGLSLLVQPLNKDTFLILPLYILISGEAKYRIGLHCRVVK